MVASRFRFIREFMTDPQAIGAVAPSSRRLAAMMIRGFDLENARTVVEVGAGTGAITAELVERVGPDTRLIAIEQSPEFVKILRERFPDLDVRQACATTTHEILAETDPEQPQADFVVSGLPWAAFPSELQNALLKSIYRCLRPGGQFTTFAYTGPSRMPKGRRFRQALRARFKEVIPTPIVWRNLPPAFAYQCRK